MSASPALSLVPSLAEQPVKRRTRVTLSATQFEKLTVIQQVRRAFAPGARLAGFIGLGIGGFVPVATYTVVHCECAIYPRLWWLVLGGLLYSAITVFTWASAAFGSRVKAAGFCVLLEGILTFGHTYSLGLAALAMLVFINAVSAACALQVRRD